jgi:hypothetical protein
MQRFVRRRESSIQGAGVFLKLPLGELDPYTYRPRVAPQSMSIHG